MSDSNARTDLSTTQARSLVANAHRGDDADLIRLHKANLACANLDNKIRIELAVADVAPVHVGHLVGLLLAASHVDGPTVALIEKLARDAAEAVAQ